MLQNCHSASIIIKLSEKPYEKIAVDIAGPLPHCKKIAKYL